MQSFRRAFLSCALLLLAFFPATAAPAPDAAALFRDEVVDAPRKLKWKGPELSDDTRFAVAAGGLSWQPEWQGTPLLRVEKKTTFYADAPARYAAFAAARDAGQHRVAFPFALSILLDPSDDTAWDGAYASLREFGPDLDRALVGVLHAPDRLPLLPAYRYAAMDALVWRASPRLLPLFLTLAESSDRYLRSRAVAGLGIASYRALAGGAGSVDRLRVPLREASVSAVQQGIVAEVVRKAAEDKNWRVRAAAALALGLMGTEDDRPVLERLAKDRAYLAFPAEGKDTKRIVYPVRAQAAVSLARFGRSAEDGGGVFSGRALKQATRGGKDVTKDRSDVRADQLGRVRFHEGLW